MMSIAASFLSLTWNTMEWNWVGFELEQNCMGKILKRVKLIPLYMIGSGYKCLSIAVIVIYLKINAIIPIIFVTIALVITKHMVKKYNRSSMLIHTPKMSSRGTITKRSFFNNWTPSGKCNLQLVCDIK